MMKTKNSLLTLAGLSAFVASAQAASFSAGFQNTIGSEQATGATAEGGPYYVSVNPNNPGYAAVFYRLPNTNTDGEPYQRSFENPVVAWTWVGGGANNVLTQDVRTDGSGLITYETESTTFDGFAQRQLELWVDSDPGPDLTNPVTPRDFQGPGYRGGFVDVTATIDISGLGAGTVYVFYGDFRGKPNLSAVMKDTDGGAPDLIIEEAHLNDDSANRGEYYVAELDFVSDGVYDEIVYVWKANGDNGSNGRFGGTVLTGGESQFVDLELSITLNQGNFDFSWNSRPGKSYDLVSSVDLAIPVADWAVYDPDGEGGEDPFGDIITIEEMITLTDVPSADSKRFFAVVEK